MREGIQLGNEGGLPCSLHANSVASGIQPGLSKTLPSMDIVLSVLRHTVQYGTANHNPCFIGQYVDHVLSHVFLLL